MRTSTLLQSFCISAALLTAHSAALAEKPDWAGQGNGKHQRENDRRDDRRDNDRDERRGDRDGRRDNDSRDTRQGSSGPQIDIRIGGYFGDTQRRAVQIHYQDEFRGGKCPPGLAKKNNGCLPPGQVRQWNLGQALPRDVTRYPLDPSVSIRLGLPPAGHEFVRVASDILLIAVGTGIVVDAIKDLGR